MSDHVIAFRQIVNALRGADLDADLPVDRASVGDVSPDAALGREPSLDTQQHRDRIDDVFEDVRAEDMIVAAIRFVLLNKRLIKAHVRPAQTLSSNLDV